MGRRHLIHIKNSKSWCPECKKLTLENVELLLKIRMVNVYLMYILIIVLI